MNHRWTIAACVSLLGTACGSSDGDHSPLAAMGLGGNAGTGLPGAGGGGTVVPGAGGGGMLPQGNGGTGTPPVGAGGGSAGSGPYGAGGAGQIALNECGLHTGYAGDEACILPPPSDKGFQIHVGPTDYDNPEAAYVLQPGDEKTDDFPSTATNDSDVFFFYRQYRMRPSAHHIILSTPNGGDILAGRRIGTANTNQDYPAGGVIAPEDAHIGLPLPAHSEVDVSFHAINTTQKVQLRESWVNFWYRDPTEITQAATEWFKTGDPGLVVAPHTEKILGPYTCSVQGSGRLLWLYGHRHANNVRFTATRVRGTQRDVIYDADKWDEPLLLEYSSLVQNAAPNVPQNEGGWNGLLDVATGDRVEWQCDVVNNHDTALRFTNQTFLGEMCIIDAEAVGATCAGI